MPLLQIKLNSKAEDINQLALSASKLTAGLLGKPESYVMVNVVDEAKLFFSGTDEPCAHLKLKSLGLNESETKNYSEKLCQFITDQTGTPGSRIYIEFFNPERHMWGWDNSTF